MFHLLSLGNTSKPHVINVVFEQMKDVYNVGSAVSLIYDMSLYDPKPGFLNLPYTTN